MAGSWPPPACPGTGKVLLDYLGALEPLEPLDFAELFAGEGAVHRALAAQGYHGRRMDLRHHQGHDLLTPVGLLLAMRIAMALKPGGLLWLAPPCSSWVWMARATTGRHLAVHGDITNGNVVRNNALAERVVLLLYITTLRGAHWIVEQPVSSLLWAYPAMRECLRRHGCTPCSLHMGAYGGSSLKPTTLMGTAPLCTA